MIYFWSIQRILVENMIFWKWVVYIWGTNKTNLFDDNCFFDNSAIICRYRWSGLFKFGVWRLFRFFGFIAFCLFKFFLLNWFMIGYYSQIFHNIIKSLAQLFTLKVSYHFYVYFDVNINANALMLQIMQIKVWKSNFWT